PCFSLEVVFRGTIVPGARPPAAWVRLKETADVPQIDDLLGALEQPTIVQQQFFQKARLHCLAISLRRRQRRNQVSQKRLDLCIVGATLEILLRKIRLEFVNSGEQAREFDEVLNADRRRHRNLWHSLNGRDRSTCCRRGRHVRDAFLRTDWRRVEQLLAADGNAGQQSGALHKAPATEGVRTLLRPVRAMFRHANLPAVRPAYVLGLYERPTFARCKLCKYGLTNWHSDGVRRSEANDAIRYVSTRTCGAQHSLRH